MLKLALALLMVAACADDGESRQAVGRGKSAVAGAQQPGGLVHGLPFAGERGFATLDDYLAFLESQSGFDTPYYQRVGPDRYQLMTRLPPGRPRPPVVTREELMRRYGFSR